MSRAAVILTGAIGALVVARAASLYRGVDPLAYYLVLLIAVGLALGVIEGLVRSSRALRLRAEVRALPAPATTEAIDAASAPLRAYLRARVAGSPAAAQPAAFTPYLLGLLVMVGLLGTFLGLFETLRGAREALVASSDVNALREGLAAPMTGLSRAFGTSAAGVTASAMLGLGAVFVRREEARLGEALAAYAAGPLAAITIAGRQLAALEALAKQGEALPVAAASLRDAVDRLAQLEVSLTAGQAKASAETAASLRAAAAEIRGDLERGIERAAAGVAAVTEPLLARAVESAGKAAGEVLAEVSDRLGRDAEERRAQQTAHLRALEMIAVDAVAELGAAAEARAEKHAAIEAERAAQRAKIEDERARERARIEEERAAKQAAIEADRLARLAAIEEERAAAQARIEADRAAKQAAIEADRAAKQAAIEAERAAKQAAIEEARAAQLDARIEHLLSVIAAAEARASEADAARLAALVEATTAVRTELARTASVMSTQSEAFVERIAAAALALSEQAKAEAERHARIDALIAELGSTAARITASTEAQASRLDKLAESAEARAATSEARAEERMVQLAERVTGVLDGQAERLAAFEARLEAARGAGAEALAERLAAHTADLGKSLGETVAIVRSASDLLRAGSAEMNAVAELFTRAVDRYRDASERWLENTRAIEDLRTGKDGGEAADLLGAYLAQTREVFDTSLQFQRELFTELRALKAKASS
jgi:hypothetical protein